jgi:5-methylcytosine-specific restriction endonuclease McrA
VVTKGAYPDNWPSIAEMVKEEAHWRCEHCGCPHAAYAHLGYCLTVHHRDGDPLNCERSNLIALCQVCHLRAQARLLRYGPEDERQMRLEI